MDTAQTDPTAPADPSAMLSLTVDQWRARADRHAARVDQLVAGHRQRTADGTAHPVEDFLFTYYRLKPAELRRWSPGHGIVLEQAPEFTARRFFRTVPGTTSDVEVDVAAFLAERSRIIDLVRRLVGRTSAAAPQFGCFGLHEWAMVYRQDDSRRHGSWPLRLGGPGTDRVVEDHRIRCSHFDAFRFFTPDAVPRNELSPTLEDREHNEQPGCLHAGMDLYKWSSKLLPLIPSDLVLDSFVLAREIRELDMRASPYDLSALGYPAVTIETADGKAEYVAAQRSFAERSQTLRARLLAALPPGA